jgi:hypothetical protein
MPKHARPQPEIDPHVPDELVVQVLVEQITETEAIERGRRAAAAQTEKERHAILFGAPTIQRPRMLLPTGPLPWFEP